jgi:PPOX class probable F420-dependent enzyme
MAHLATTMPDGSPQVTPVAVIVVGDQIHVSSTRHTVKAKNMMRDPRVALSMTSAENPWFSGHVRGRVVEITEEGARELLDAMSAKHGRKVPPSNYADRLVFKIEAISAFGRNSPGPEPL